MKAPPVSITVKDLTLRFPVYGVDAKSLKKHLARVAIGGRLSSAHHGTAEVTAISGLSMTLKAGDRLGLIGHNGSGKTTLLRALSGAYEPDEGQIEVKGRIAPLLDLSLGIDPSATGLENIRLRGRIAGLTTKEIDSKMEEIGRFTGLGPFLAMPLKTYSAGMAARLAFAVGHRRGRRRPADGRVDRGRRRGLPENSPPAPAQPCGAGRYPGPGVPRHGFDPVVLQQGHAYGRRRRFAGHEHQESGPASRSDLTASRVINGMLACTRRMCR